MRLSMWSLPCWSEFALYDKHTQSEAKVNENKFNLKNSSYVLAFLFKYKFTLHAWENFTKIFKGEEDVCFIRATRFYYFTDNIISVGCANTANGSQWANCEWTYQLLTQIIIKVKLELGTDTSVLL